MQTDFPHHVLGKTAFAVTPEDLINERVHRLKFGFPFIDVAPTQPGYDHLWAGYRPAAHSAGMNRAHVAVGTAVRDGTITREKGRELVPTPHVHPVLGLGSVGVDRPTGVHESSMVRESRVFEKGRNASERETPFYAHEYREDVLPDLSLMKPGAPASVIFPGVRGGASARTMDRYSSSAFSMKWGEYVSGPIAGSSAVSGAGEAYAPF